MRLVFLGTPRFAAPTLERIVEAGHQVLAVVTQPDRPSGRGQHAAPPPVKQSAQRLGLPVYQPERVRRPEAVEYLRALAPDAMVVVGYGKIIPQSVIDIPPLGIINVHGSLTLPRNIAGGINPKAARRNITEANSSRLGKSTYWHRSSPPVRPLFGVAAWPKRSKSELNRRWPPAWPGCVPDFRSADSRRRTRVCPLPSGPPARSAAR